MWREAQAEGRQHTLAALQRARAGYTRWLYYSLRKDRIYVYDAIHAHGSANDGYACTNRVMTYYVAPSGAGHAGCHGLPVHPTAPGLLFHRLQTGGELLDHLHLPSIGLHQLLGEIRQPLHGNRQLVFFRVDE